jgi:hypothetical protein
MIEEIFGTSPLIPLTSIVDDGFCKGIVLFLDGTFEYPIPRPVFLFAKFNG